MILSSSACREQLQSMGLGFIHEKDFAAHAIVQRTEVHARFCP